MLLFRAYQWNMHYPQREEHGRESGADTGMAIGKYSNKG